MATWPMHVPSTSRHSVFMSLAVSRDSRVGHTKWRRRKEISRKWRVAWDKFPAHHSWVWPQPRRGSHTQSAACHTRARDTWVLPVLLDQKDGNMQLGDTHNGVDTQEHGELHRSVED